MPDNPFHFEVQKGDRRARSGQATFSDDLVLVPPRRGFALRDALDRSQAHRARSLGRAIEQLNRQEKYDRLLVITDEQARDTLPAPKGKGYVINLASYKNGVGYGEWTHIDAWSESIVEYVRVLEQTGHAGPGN